MVSLRRHFVPNPVPSSETRFALRSKSPLFLHTRYNVLGEEVSVSQPNPNIGPANVVTSYTYDDPGGQPASHHGVRHGGQQDL